MADRKKKREMETQKIKYLENGKSFLDEIKAILKGYHLVINKNWLKNSRHKL